MKPLSVVQKKIGKSISPQEYLLLLKRNANNKQWILKQLQQLDIDIKMLQDYSLPDLYNHCEQILKSTYSIKYLGMNDNEMGIISRRLDPFKDSNFSLKNLPQNPYIINRYFYPKPLKVGYKRQKSQKINSQNLEAEIISAFSSHTSQKGKRSTEKRKNCHLRYYKIKDKRNKSESVLSVLEEKDPQIKLWKPEKHLSNSLFTPKVKSSFHYSYSHFLKNGLILIKRRH